MHTTVPRLASVDPASLERIKAFVLGATFPCVGARSAINSQRAMYGSFGSLGCDEPVHLQALCESLMGFSMAYSEPGDVPVTYMALFDDDVCDEVDFERRLWRHLQLLHSIDRRDFVWAHDVSDDPDSPEFSFSIAGRAFFIVGLHPNSSRISRRAPMPCLAFNFHDQFELLRASGKFEKMQRAIRLRDVALQGNANPALKSFGEASEARQYSGRSVEDHWHCPFRPGDRDAA